MKGDSSLKRTITPLGVFRRPASNSRAGREAPDGLNVVYEDTMLQCGCHRTPQEAAKSLLRSRRVSSAAGDGEQNY